ncbi:hypothetical protein MAPG_10376 [Magnaporthiopsis poae ATCC 64411]|uniref:Uncharacterized protein n=1 Tax=Magnaporthiopsis poae (strain ATCC 64411 / 73-15) TaxID=644358 RepID=A0A0C4ECF2_MAGP6|nr:hypothetical protein MAPG_10376 [Magnaporthiopsis poae ATCC 64411]
MCYEHFEQFWCGKKCKDPSTVVILDCGKPDCAYKKDPNERTLDYSEARGPSRGICPEHGHWDPHRRCTFPSSRSPSSARAKLSGPFSAVVRNPRGVSASVIIIIIISPFQAISSRHILGSSNN